MAWHFAKTEDKTNSGANVQELETFDVEGSIIREVIQNSLDAKREDCKTVTVEIEISKKDTNKFPGKYDLIRTLDACFNQFSQGDEKSSKTIKSMRDSFNKPEHYMVTFRDLNTTGLRGGLDEETDSNTNLYQLIYGNGTTNKNTQKSSGGSFGIGKIAPFTRTSIRTVFYETYNIDNERYFVGKAFLTSHKIDGEKRVQRGYYIEDDGQIERYINNSGMRKEYGTAIHIPFYTIDDVRKEYKKLLKDLLLNFMVAIDQEKLEVKFIDKINHNQTIVDKKNYSEKTKDMLRKLKENKEKKKIIAMHNLLTSKGARIFDLYPESDDEENYIELYVALNAVSTGYKKYFNVRKQLMLIEDRKINGKNFKYDALAIYHGTKLNNVLREAEPPEHNKWEKKKLKTKKDKEYFDLVKKTVEDKLIELFGEVTSEKIVLKEYDNNIFSETKEYEEVFRIRKISEKTSSSVKGKSAQVGKAALYGTNRKVKNKLETNDKSQLNEEGNIETSVVSYPNVIKKIRTKGNGRYKVELKEYFDPQKYCIKIMGKTDNGKLEEITNFNIINNDGKYVELQLNDVELDINLEMEKKYEIEK